MAPGAIRILIADDYEVVRAGMKASIERETDMRICAMARDGSEAVEMFRLHRPDVTLMDLRMPQMDGVAAIAAILAEFPKARILVMTVPDEKAAIFRALSVGAAAYVLKTAPRAEMIAAIRALHAKYYPFAPV